MQIDLTGQHVDITSPLREYASGKLERLVRHSGQVMDVHVILSVENSGTRRRPGYASTAGSCTATEEDMYAAIDALTDKLDRQVKKHNEKMNDHHKNEDSLKNHV